MIAIADADIGGGRVRRPFTMAGQYIKAGQEFSRDEVLAMGSPNRKALIDSGYLEVWPRPSKMVPENSVTHIVSRGFGKFDVILGHKLNDEPLTKEEAEALSDEFKG